MKRRILNFLQIRLAKHLILIFIAVFILQGCSQQPTANLQSLTLSKYPNYYLICPQNYCNVTPNENSPEYPVSADDLFNAWNLMISQEQNVTVLDSVPSRGQYDYIAKTSAFGFPNIVTVQFIALTDTSSTIAVYSRSKFGFYDFGLNKKRLQKWMQQLNISVNNLFTTGTISTVNSTDTSTTSTDNTTASTNNSTTTNNTTSIDNITASGTVATTDNAPVSGNMPTTDNTNSGGNITTAPSNNSVATGNATTTDNAPVSTNPATTNNMTSTDSAASTATTNSTAMTGTST